jgi:threonine dehydrogenase-like Zn-dependent dehydrogenase
MSLGTACDHNAMQAAWLEDQELSVREVPKPELPAGEALVRVLLAGICNTDIELTRGYYPYTGIPGHEFVGVVESGAPSLLGRRVVGEINAVCHACEACRHGRSTHCENRNVLGIINRNGAFAEYLTLPVENLHLVPDEMPSEVAVFTEPLAAALEIQEQIDIGAEDRVLIVGAGKLGQLIAATLKMTGCKLTIAGRHRGIPSAEVSSGAFDIAIECSGSPEGFEVARRSLRPRGTLVMKSTYAGKLEINASSLVVDEITLIGSRCGPFSPALALLASGAVNPRPFIERVFPLRDVLVAFEFAQRPGVLKVLIAIDNHSSSR